MLFLIVTKGSKVRDEFSYGLCYTFLKRVFQKLVCVR